MEKSRWIQERSQQSENGRAQLPKRSCKHSLDLLIFTRNLSRTLLKTPNLTPLTGKKEWLWGEDQERSFRSLIDKMCKELVLWTIKDEGSVMSLQSNSTRIP